MNDVWQVRSEHNTREIDKKGKEILEILDSYHEQMNELNDGERHRGWEGDNSVEDCVNRMLELMEKYSKKESCEHKYLPMKNCTASNIEQCSLCGKIRAVYN